MRLNNIQDMDSANQYLQEIFIPTYWNKTIIIEPEDDTSEYRPVPVTVCLDDVCVQKEYRKIRNDHTFSYGNKMYLINSDLKYSIAKQEITIHKLHNGEFTAYFADRLLEVTEVIEPTRQSMYDLEIQKKIDAISLAEKLGSVAEAARRSGCSRETIYKNRRLLKQHGPQALKRQFKPGKHHGNRTSMDIETTVIAFSLENPHLGQSQISAQLKVHYQLEISSSGVRNIWLRENMNTSALRLERSRSLSD